MTLEDNTNNVSHLFSSKLRKYEDKLVEIIMDIGASKHVNLKISKISSYLLIHGNLTQKELRELTGFSMGSISTFISVMVGTGTYEKNRIPHSHTYTYSFSGELEDLITKGLEIALSSFSSFEKYLDIKKRELNKLIERSKKGAEELLQRINELLEIFKIYEKIIPLMIRNSVKDVPKDIHQKEFSLSKEKMKKEKKIQFDSEVFLVEDDIINQLVNSPMFFTRDPMFIKILGYFITRKYLTQKRIQRITGLSAGKVSQEVNNLLENELIEIVDISEKGKITYRAESAGIILLKFSRSIINRMVKWEAELYKMKKELEDGKQNMENLEGHARICRINNYILDSISIYKRFIDLVDKVLEG